MTPQARRVTDKTVSEILNPSKYGEEEQSEGVQKSQVTRLTYNNKV